MIYTKNIITAALFFCTAVASEAAIALNATLVNDQISTDALGFLVVDTNGDGFGPVLEGSYSISDGNTGSGSFLLDGSDDRIVAIGDFRVGFAGRSLFLDNNNVRTTTDTPAGPFDISESDVQFAIYWFPTLDIDDTTLSAGDSYGIARFDSTSDSESTSTIGSDFILGGNVEGDYNVAVTGDSALANFTVIPEPSSTALLGLGGLALLARRRRA